MHHYPFHVGDYRKDTANLSLLEHGVYRSLIDCYYLQETPLVADKDKLCRMIGARTPEEKQAVSYILDDYFTLKSDGYHHSGCHKVLEKIYGRSEAARKSAAMRWGKHEENMHKTCERIENECERIANASESDANEMLPTTHNPLPITHNKTPSSSGDDKPETKHPDYQSIIDLYHKILPQLPSVKILTDKRKSAMRSCCQLKPSYYGIDFWEAYFEQASKSDFLMGRKTDWKADFDFLVTKSKFVKVLEGSYE